MLEPALLGIDRDAAVVANMLVRPGRNVEETGLAAVGIAHKGYPDHVPAFFGELDHHCIEAFVLAGTAALYRA